MTYTKLFIPLFSPNAEKRHGGVRRSSQLAELYEYKSHSVESIYTRKVDFWCVLAHLKDFLLLACFALALGQLRLRSEKRCTDSKGF